MKIEIHRLQKNLEIHENVKSITIPTPHGAKGFLPHHISFISEITKGTLDIQLQGRHHIKIPLEKGYVHFENNVCKVFLMDKTN